MATSFNVFTYYFPLFNLYSDIYLLHPAFINVINLLRDYIYSYNDSIYVYVFYVSFYLFPGVNNDLNVAFPAWSFYS